MQTQNGPVSRRLLESAASQVVMQDKPTYFVSTLSLAHAPSPVACSGSEAQQVQVSDLGRLSTQSVVGAYLHGPLRCKEECLFNDGNEDIENDVDEEAHECVHEDLLSHSDPSVTCMSCGACCTRCILWQQFCVGPYLASDWMVWQ